MNKEAKRLKKILDAKRMKKDVDIPSQSDHIVNTEVKKTDYCVSKEETLSEYFAFLRNLPVLPDFEKNKLINLVKDEWGIDEILNLPLIPEKLIHLKNGHDLTERLSTKLGKV
jgi:hypothetical protein